MIKKVIYKKPKTTNTSIESIKYLDFTNKSLQRKIFKQIMRINV